MNLLATDIFDLFRAQFKRCHVKANERTAVLAEANSRPEYVEAAFAALKSLDTTVVLITVPSCTGSLLPGEGLSADLLEGNLPAIEALSLCDFVVDVSSSAIVHSAYRVKIQERGARILTVIEPPDVLARCTPSVDLKNRVLVAGRLLDAANKFHVRSDHGTDISFDRGTNPLGLQYGLADEPGRWDHWPSGMAAVYPEDGTAEGVIVLAPGDIVFPLARYIQSPVTFEIEKGWIRKISGAGLDAEFIRGYMDVWNQPEAYATSHIGWGLDHSAQWITSQLYGPRDLIGMDGRCFAGNFLWSTGPNKFVGRHTSCHYDIAMRGCTITLDDRIVVDNGQIAYDESTGE